MNADRTIGSPVAGRERAAIPYAVRAALAVVVVAWLALRGDLASLGATLGRLSLPWFAGALVLYLVGQSLCAWRWSLLAGALGFRRSARFYWTVYLGAMFPSLFLPTSVGGDLLRILALGRRGQHAAATVSVLGDRGTGFLALVWIAALAATAGPFQQRPALSVLYGGCAALTLGFVLPFRFRPRFRPGSFPDRVLECWRQPGRLLAALGAAAAFQVIDCLTHAMLGRALGLSAPISFYFLLCPLVSIAGMSPITLYGIGERTAATLFLFAAIGVGREAALAFGLAWTTMALLAALFGGAVLLLFGEERGGIPSGGIGA